MRMSSAARCVVCGAGDIAPVVRVENAPVSCNHLCPSREAALSEPTAPIALGFCRRCGHLFNTEFDASRLDYRPGYENSLEGSGRFREYEEQLVARLVERYDLRSKTIVEIGCGRGDFLRRLCQHGPNSGIGFDPSYSGSAEPGNPAEMEIRGEAFGSRDHQLDVDFICSRHTLEHVPEPACFLSSVRTAAGRAGIPVFFEVPNGLFTIRDGGIWDIIYEHRSYFTASSLARLLSQTGYEPLETAEAFAGQFLTVHGLTANQGKLRHSEPPSDLDYLIGSFMALYKSRIDFWRRILMKLATELHRVVIWGAGAKAATFLNLFRPDNIEYVIDINSRKHGNYVAGTGQQIVPPEFLRDYRPDDIICMNPNYVGEISDTARSMGVRANMLSA